MNRAAAAMVFEMATIGNWLLSQQVPEVMAVWADANSTGHCQDTVCCSAINPGLYAELLRRGDVRAPPRHSRRDQA
jgi:hypothetical protein